MQFAAITSVDDDVETKQAVQKVGNKTIYNGIETKLAQLMEEGYVVDAINNFSSLWKSLSDKEQNNSNIINEASKECKFNMKPYFDL